MMMGKFLDPKNDYAFKRIFGAEKHKNILIHFINDMLGFRGDSKIETVSFLQPSQNPDIAYKKQSILDVLCTDPTGRQYIVEMQVAKTAGFEKRAQYYAAKAYGGQLNKGEEYEQLKEVIFLAITDFVMFPDKADYLSNHVTLDKKTYTRDLKDFSFTFLELPKFHKTIDELHTMIEKWAYFFKYADETNEKDLNKIAGDDVVIEEAYEILNRFSFSEAEMRTYEAEEKRVRDNQAVLRQQMYDLEAAKAKGLAEGKAEGKAEGIESVVINMLKAKAEIAFIAQCTGLSEDVIKNIRSKLS